MANMQNEQKINLFLIVLVGANLLAIAFYLYGVNEVSRGRGEIEKEVQKLSQTVVSNSDLEKQVEILGQTEAEREKINRYFIDTKKTARFLEELEDLGEDIGVSINIESVQVENKTTLRVDLLANGSFRNVYHLLEALYALPYTIEFRALRTSRINISSKETTSKGPLWGSTISLRVVNFSNI